MTICGFRHPLGVLQCIPVDEGDYCIENCKMKNEIVRLLQNWEFIRLSL